VDVGWLGSLDLGQNEAGERDPRRHSAASDCRRSQRPRARDIGDFEVRRASRADECFTCLETRLLRVPSSSRPPLKATFATRLLSNLGASRGAGNSAKVSLDRWTVRWPKSRPPLAASAEWVHGAWRVARCREVDHANPKVIREYGQPLSGRCARGDGWGATTRLLATGRPPGEANHSLQFPLQWRRQQPLRTVTQITAERANCANNDTGGFRRAIGADVTQNSDGQSEVRSGLISGADSFLERARNFIVSTAVVVGFLLIAFSLIVNGWSGRYSIEPISAPDDFLRNVESSVGIAALLRDDLNKLVTTSGTNVAIKPVGDQKAPEVTVMGTTLSLDYFVGALRRLMGTQYPRITGEISYVDKNSTPTNPPMLCPDLAKSKAEVKLVLRVGDDGGVPFFEGEGSFLDVSLCGALYTLRIVDPYSAASYLGQRDQTQMQAFKLLEEAAAESASSDMAEIDLIRGNIQLGKGNTSEAERLFDQASADYNDRHRVRVGWFGWYPAFDGLATMRLEEGGWYPAFDGLATTYLLEGRYEQASASVEKALELQHDYKSALFHKAQISDFLFRGEVYEDRSKKCTMLKHVYKAKNAYHDVVTAYPDMAVAYFNEGLMLLLLDTYRRFHPIVGCERGDADYSPEAEAIIKDLAKFDGESEWNFRQAILLDPDDPNAWLQLGILLAQRQEPRMWGKPLTTDFRRKTLSEAIEYLNTAKKLRPDDVGIRSRLVQAESEREAIEAIAYFNTAKNPDDIGIQSRLIEAKSEQGALQ
jgi:tetratricopeptide (TPR) repeat protein